MSEEVKHVDRTGLYLLVFFIFMQSCGTYDTTQRIQRKLDAVQPCATK